MIKQQKKMVIIGNWTINEDNEDVHSLKRTRQPKKWWFVIGIPFSRGLYSGAMLASGRVFVAIEPWKFSRPLRLMPQKPY